MSVIQENFHQRLLDAVSKELSAEVEKVIEEHATKAANAIRLALRKRTAEIAVSLMADYSLSAFGTDLTIRVKHILEERK